jgi:hypothetical protein
VDCFGRSMVVLTVCIGGAIGALLLLAMPGAGLSASLLFGLIGIGSGGSSHAAAGQGFWYGYFLYHLL